MICNTYNFKLNLKATMGNKQKDTMGEFARRKLAKEGVAIPQSTEEEA